ncbi:MAG TPA: hypothetical protein VEV81_04960, partial [Pyrinomonadaceae bacterium]|nr:hypothetical protein [Pyrinomonadaceae bacterium]
MFFALALGLIAVTGGALVTYLFDEDAPLLARLCAGAPLGLAAFGLICFVLASLFGFGYPVLLFGALLLASPFLLMTRKKLGDRVRADFHEAVRGARRAILHPSGRTTLYIVFYAFIALLLWAVFDRAMVELSDGIYTGVKNNYGDLPFHLSIITRFTEGANFPPEDPTWAGARFTYPFMVDFVAACFVRAGATLREAMLLENLLLSLSLVGLLHRFTLKLTRDWLAGLIAPVLVLFSGGLGWWHFFKDSPWGARGVVNVLLNVQQQYTINDNGYRWGNSLTTLLVPQRGILFGLTLAIVVFTIWWQTIRKDSVVAEGFEERSQKKQKKGKRKGGVNETPAQTRPRIPEIERMAVAGAIAGLLPLVHAHSYIVVMVVGAGVALLTGLKEWRAWAAFFVISAVIAAPQMWWATHGSSVEAESFFGWNFGWDKGAENFVWFWLKNTGLLIPLVVTALLWRRDAREGGGKYLVPPKLLLFYLPFTLCFIIPNLIKLAPWVWDNIKVIFYWFLASVPLVALLLARLLRANFLSRALGVALLLTLTLAGALDVWAVASRASEFRIFDADGVSFAEMVKQLTPPRSTILHAPTFDTPIFLTGRRSVMGYPGHISSHGIKYDDRQREVERIYAGSPGADDLMAKYGVEYVVTGPQEQSVMTQRRMSINNLFFSQYQL